MIKRERGEQALDVINEEIIYPCAGIKDTLRYGR